MSIFQNNLFLAIMDQVNEFLQEYLDYIFNFLADLPVWAQGAIFLGLGLFAIVGLFVFFKKFVKLFIGLAILGVIVYLVWDNTTIIQDLLGSVTGGSIISIKAFMQ
ncbi:MAG: hypothetical protein KJ971_01440 [Firmicutes bacterium]|nr:hypothetical protein [Bacillota bacterium]